MSKFPEQPEARQIKHKEILTDISYFIEVDLRRCRDVQAAMFTSAVTVEAPQSSVPVCLLGIPHDDNSSFMKGAAEAPALIRRELHSDAYSMWSETGIDLSVPQAGSWIMATSSSIAPVIRGISSSAMWGARWSQAIR